MRYKRMHRAYHPLKGGAAVPADRLINDLGDSGEDYIGTFSEHNPLGYSHRGNIAVTVLKDASDDLAKPQKDFKLPGFVVKESIGMHSEDFNNNGSVQFSKQDLLQIANAMDDSDKLHICSPDQINTIEFQKGIHSVTKIHGD